MVNLTNIPKTEQPTMCVVPSFDVTYVEKLLNDSNEYYAIYRYTDVFRGLAPITLEEAIEEIDSIDEFDASRVPIVLKTKFEPEALRQALKPLFTEPLDEDFITWQKQFITSQIYETPNVQPFRPIPLDKNLISNGMLDKLSIYTKGASS